MTLAWSDLTVEQRRALIVFDDRFRPVPANLTWMQEHHAPTLVRLGLVDPVERRITERGIAIMEDRSVPLAWEPAA